MDVSGETADLLIKEGIQATEGAIKLAGVGLKNVAALLIAISRQDNKVVGQTTAKRLARDPAPAEVVQIKKADIPKFQKLAKEYGVLYFFVNKKGIDTEITNVVSNVNYAPQLNAVLEELGYPIPERKQAQEPTKKVIPRTQQEPSSPERENGSIQRAGTSTPEKPSVKGRLAALQAASEGMSKGIEKIKDHVR